jgi:hypothetical protein
VQVGDLWEAVPPWYRLPYSRFAAPQAGPKDGETTWGETAKCNTPRPPEGGRQPAGAQLWLYLVRCLLTPSDSQTQLPYHQSIEAVDGAAWAALAAQRCIQPSLTIRGLLHKQLVRSCNLFLDPASKGVQSTYSDA